MNRGFDIKGLFLLVGLVVFFYSLLPLGTALLFGADEGCELMKSVMSNQGFALYKDIWNDQPPLFTLFLGGIFKLFGTSLIIARIFAAGFGLLLFGAFYLLVEQRLGRWKAMLAAFLLIAAPGVALLSASAMLEVPAFAMALLSVLFLFQWRKNPHLGWLVASGGVMGIALQIKLTAMLVVPAMLVEMVLNQTSVHRRPWWKNAFMNVAGVSPRKMTV